MSGITLQPEAPPAHPIAAIVTAISLKRERGSVGAVKRSPCNSVSRGRVGGSRERDPAPPVERSVDASLGGPRRGAAGAGPRAGLAGADGHEADRQHGTEPFEWTLVHGETTAIRSTLRGRLRERGLAEGQAPLRGHPPVACVAGTPGSHPRALAPSRVSSGSFTRHQRLFSITLVWDSADSTVRSVCRISPDRDHAHRQPEATAPNSSSGPVERGPTARWPRRSDEKSLCPVEDEDVHR